MAKNNKAESKIAEAAQDALKVIAQTATTHSKATKIVINKRIQKSALSNLLIWNNSMVTTVAYYMVTCSSTTFIYDFNVSGSLLPIN